MGDFNLNEIQEPVKKKEAKKFSHIGMKSLLRLLAWISIVTLLMLSVNYIYTLKYRNREDVINIGYVDKESAVLFTIAEEMKFFESENSGLKVDLRRYGSTKNLVKAWEKGRLDFIILEDISIIVNYESLSNVNIVSSVANFDTYKMVVDLKKSIIELNDLEGRTIGVTSDDEFDYWLDSGLQNAGVNRQKVTTEYINKKDFGKKLANGKVDAVFAKYPDTSYVQKYANSEIQTMALSLQYHKRAHALLIGSNAYVNEKNGDTNKLLMALSQAQDHYENNKDLVRDSLPTIWEEEKSYIDNVLEDYEYRLQLNSEIFAQMDSQATWATAKGILKDDPDLKSIVNYSLLRKVRPEDVTL